MSTINGIGTRHLSWQHQDDGSSYATVWICIFYLPIFPLKRHHLKVLNEANREKVIGVKEVIAALSPHKEVVDKYNILEELPLNRKEVLNTYLYAWLIHPLAMAAPFIAMWIFVKLFSGFIKNKEWMLWVFTVWILASFGFVMIYASTLFHKSRGAKN